jgi:hypothetical protein
MDRYYEGRLPIAEHRQGIFFKFTSPWYQEKNAEGRGLVLGVLFILNDSKIFYLLILQILNSMHRTSVLAIAKKSNS